MTLIDYAASYHNSPKTYGSTARGMEVAAYRAQRKQEYMRGGMDYSEAARMAEKNVINKYGAPL